VNSLKDAFLCYLKTRRIEEKEFVDTIFPYEVPPSQVNATMSDMSSFAVFRSDRQATESFENEGL
jgi:hypothetical protein